MPLYNLGNPGESWGILGNPGVFHGVCMRNKFLYIYTKGIPRGYIREYQGNTKGIHKAIHIPKAKGIPREYHLIMINID
jgi:hypothetical protein